MKFPFTIDHSVITHAYSVIYLFSFWPKISAKASRLLQNYGGVGIRSVVSYILLRLEVPHEPITITKIAADGNAVLQRDVDILKYVNNENVVMYRFDLNLGQPVWSCLSPSKNSRKLIKLTLNFLYEFSTWDSTEKEMHLRTVLSGNNLVFNTSLQIFLFKISFSFMLKKFGISMPIIVTGSCVALSSAQRRTPTHQVLPTHN